MSTSRLRNICSLLNGEVILHVHAHYGANAGKAAGMYVVATTNLYTEEEDLSQADIIVTCLGDPDGQKAVLKKGDNGPLVDGVLTLDRLLHVAQHWAPDNMVETNVES